MAENFDILDFFCYNFEVDAQIRLETHTFCVPEFGEYIRR